MGLQEVVPDRQASSSTRRTRTSSTSAPSAGSTARTRSAACSRPTDGGKTWEKVLLRRRQDRRHRHRDAPDRTRTRCSSPPGSGSATTSTASSATPGRGRPTAPTPTPRPRSTPRAAAIYKTTDGGKTFDEADQGPADGEARPHRPRLLPQGPATSSSPSSTPRRSARARPRRRRYLGVQGETDATAASRSPAVTADSPAAKAGLEGRRRASPPSTARRSRPYEATDRRAPHDASRATRSSSPSAAARTRRTSRSRFGPRRTASRTRPQLGADRLERGRGRARWSPRSPKSAPAAKAGLKVGDLITAIDGKPVEHAPRPAPASSPARRSATRSRSAYTPRHGEEDGRGRRSSVPAAATAAGPAVRRRPASAASARTSRTSKGPTALETGGIYKSTDGGEIVDAHQQPQPAADVLLRRPRRSDRRQHALRPRRHAVPHHRRRQDVHAGRRSTAASTPTSTPCGSTRRTAGT